MVLCAGQRGLYKYVTLRHPMSRSGGSLPLLSEHLKKLQLEKKVAGGGKKKAKRMRKYE